MSFKIIKGLSDIWENYDGYIVDLWGVIHDGHVLYPDVLRSLAELRALKKQVVFLSNAPRKSKFIKDRLSELKISPDLYRGIVTSGDDAFETMIETYIPKFGHRAFFLGGEKDRHMLDAKGLNEATSLEEADFILGINTYKGEDSLETYTPLLEKGLTKGIPFICVNPDLIVHIKGQEIICAGTLADWYKSQGGDVFYHGKPHGPVYKRALNTLDVEDKSKILCIGDSLRTDVTGALGQGLDVAFITGGIHKSECLETKNELSFEKNLEQVFQKHGKVPTLVLPEFKR
ncbi:MAG: hypothetical protein B7Y25_07785 [Alphaproteobacteria bacterium 16-39-46]|nr:MAG: hypothetical protein B7Y25_07785 [Alphaproteobacteria bacterium 16-39-46]OZA41532.1 MAG: hypothetical protein B7X84_07785 [Alphaproteobacteria bacterium 17-39-52]HQS84796.1 TIGR01459 family HAD-type hydrolase [Alphaproteobacteria bacterium]HQS94593.1 TIGR01459 family HAD-type hydrolase [Alphaproteobacteria bacterium]